MNGFDIEQQPIQVRKAPRYKLPSRCITNEEFINGQLACVKQEIYVQNHKNQKMQFATQDGDVRLPRRSMSGKINKDLKLSELTLSHQKSPNPLYRSQQRSYLDTYENKRINFVQMNFGLGISVRNTFSRSSSIQNDRMCNQALFGVVKEENDNFEYHKNMWF